MKNTLIAILFSLIWLLPSNAQTVSTPANKATRVLCYNVRNGISPTTNKANLNNVAEVIRKINPHFAALQELDSVTNRSGKRYVLGELAEKTNMHPVFAPAIDYDGGKYGIGLLSKEKPLKWQIVPLPGGEPRVLLAVEFEQSVIAVIHFPLTPEERLECVKIITEKLKNYDKPVILAGDFNATPDSESFRELSKDFTLLSSCKQGTYPAPVAKECIDYIFGLNGDFKFKVKATETLSGIDASDHLPLYVDVIVK